MHKDEKKPTFEAFYSGVVDMLLVGKLGNEINPENIYLNEYEMGLFNKLVKSLKKRTEFLDQSQVNNQIKGVQ